MKLRNLLSILLFLIATPSWAQIPGQDILVNRTPVIGGTSGQCLYKNGNVVGAQACGAGTAANIQVGVTTVGGGTSGYVLYNNAGVLGNLQPTGSGLAVLQTSPTLITPVLGVATGTSLALNGATLGSNVFAGAGSAYLTGSTVGFTPLLLESTEAAAALGPIAEIYRNSASAVSADVLGGINFTGNSATGVKRTLASIQSVITTATNTAEVGSVNIWTMRAGALVNSLFVSNGGAVRLNGAATSSLGFTTSGTDPTGAQSAGFSLIAGGTISLDGATIGDAAGRLRAFSSALGGCTIGTDTLCVTGTVNISSNLTAAGTAITFANLPSDAATTNNTVCVTTTTGVLTKGSGAIGICLGTSSARYKHDIAAQHAGLKEIAALEPVTYYYNKGYGDDGARRQHGFTAEQVYEVMPGIVGLDTEGRPNTVDWAALVPVMVGAIKELKAELNELRSR